MSGTVSIDLGLNQIHPSGGLLDIDILGTNINTIFFIFFFYFINFNYSSIIKVKNN